MAFQVKCMAKKRPFIKIEKAGSDLLKTIDPYTMYYRNFKNR